MIHKDTKVYREMTRGKMPLFLIVVGILGVLAAAGLTVLKAYIFALVAGAAGAVSLAWGIWEKRSAKKQSAFLREKYANSNEKRWGDPVTVFEAAMEHYRVALKHYQDITGELEVRQMILTQKREALCGIREPEALIEWARQTMDQWDLLTDAQREARQAKAHYEGLNAMLKIVEKPAMPDTLTQSEEETSRLLTEVTLEQQRLQNRLGQYQGRMEMLGSREELEKQLRQIRQRIEKLEDTYTALTIAQETLAEARAELQRRFVPRITRKAQKFLGRMTQGRYHGLTMSADFSLRAMAGEEDTLQDALWRSDGTMDQLYLALRLAVAEELTPQAPLVLDDALVRFDDKRMAETVDLLRDMAKEKQILLFTCQGREARA